MMIKSEYFTLVVSRVVFPSFLVGSQILMASPYLGKNQIQAVNAIQPWVGKFKGSCFNKSTNTAKPSSSEFAATRTVEPIAGTSNFTWNTIFEFGAAKDYKLVPVDVAKGFYLIDEGPVKLDSYLVDNVFYSTFEYKGVRLTSREKLDGDRLSIEYISFDAKQNKDTSTSKLFNFPMQSLMTCELLKED